MKTCTKCQQNKPFEEFVKDKRRKDGHGTYCLPCVREYANALYQRPDQKQAKQKYYEEHCTELNAQSRQRYTKNKDRYRVVMDKWAEENRDSMLAYYRQKGSDFRAFTDTLKSKPCMDCNKFFPPCVMEYDHVSGSKRWALGKMSNHRREAVIEELVKCDLVCCACHRVRSHIRRGESKIPKVQEFRVWLNQIKSNPCMDCGLTLHHTAMDFDHVRGEKTSGVSQMWSWGRHRVIEEISKCELVCANCHRVRTQVRRDVARSVMPDNLSIEETY